ncbi:MAG: tRNA preQ1(34) S-adenosylmethionine ribosyltransferase-isomerase QueA [bacterium]|nr:tRNA preQ1(34) S-adenosylmethionine ribosyltransferase-isomerase QueA [bacterium]
MDFRTNDFDYELPREAIAQPPARRDRSRMLVLRRSDDGMEHRTIRDFPALLAPGDCVVRNDTKVFKARVHGTIEGKNIELLLVRPRSYDLQARGEQSEWLVLAKPARRLSVGATVRIDAIVGSVREREADGSVWLAFDCSTAAVIATANRIGEVPTPPYVTGSVEQLEEYQTSYAAHEGSVAAPTAGFHLTDRMCQELNTKGVRIVSLTLHVGLGTFQPIRAERLADHAMHAEWVSIPQETIETITATKRAGGRVVAIGTTTLRALEGAWMEQGALRPFSGPVDCFIIPGHAFPVVDALLTNFHLPRSTLLVLVSAFVAPGERSLRGRDMVLRAYREALAQGYRFYSFGDSMFIA